MYKYISVLILSLQIFVVGCKKEETTNSNTTNTTTTITPTVSTDSVTNITPTSATCGGFVLSDGGANVTGRGVCFDTVPNPTIASNHTINAAGTGAFVSNITGLIPSTLYYIRAYATNSLGTSYGLQRNFTTANPIVIGMQYQGGTVGYILQPGDPGYDPNITHGLIVSQLINSGVPWGCGTVITQAAFGTGLQNTINILNSCTNSNAPAALCHNSTLGGYNDWYLPSIDELSALCLNRNLIGGLPNNVFWSSTQLNGTYAKAYWFGQDGNLQYCSSYCKWDQPTTSNSRVIAVRNF